MNSHEQALACIQANDIIGFRTVLSEIDDNVHQGELLWTAANLGRVDMVADLLMVTNSEYVEEALMVAVRFEQEECITLLLQHITTPPNSALWMACEQNDVENVHLLLPHCNIYQNNCVLELAVRTQNQDLFNQVYADSNLDQWKSHLSGTDEHRTMLRNNFQALYIHYCVHENLPTTPSTVKRKM